MSEPGGNNPLLEALENPQPAPSLAQPGDVGPELGRYDEAEPFPPGCPVKPLGNSQDITGSQRCYYLNWNGQLVGLEANNRHGKLGLAALFGPSIGWLEANFPQWSAPQYEGRGKDRQLVKPSEIIGFDQAEAAQALVIECTRQGVFDPAGRLRGRGAHRIDARGMALHCGDKVYVTRLKADGSVRDWQWIETGLHGGYVYPAASAIPRPHHEPVGEGPGIKLLELIRTWNWKRPLLDPRFALGWIGAAMIGGALRWRPNIWLTGGAGTGKSTFNGMDGVLHQLFGDGMFRTGNASAAAIRQSLKNSTVPVLFDELEAVEGDNRRQKEVIELARVSSSGDSVHRGGQDHQAHEFTLRSCFQFSSILIPPLEPQDRSRLAILQLLPLTNQKGIDLASYNLPALGKLLQRRMIDGWHRVEATKLKFHAALALAKHSARACDQFGTLLACADVLINDWDTEDGLPDDEEVARWAGFCSPDRMAEVNEATADHEACATRILTSMVQARGGDEREALGNWIGQAMEASMAPLLTESEHRDKYVRRLQEIGLKIVQARRTEKGAWGAVTFEDIEAPAFLAVAGSHQGLDQVFAGSKWAGGVWRQSLARTPGAIEGVKVAFGHAKLRAVLVPIGAVLDEIAINDASKGEAFAAWLAKQNAEGAEA